MRTQARTSSLMKPWAWLAALAAVCLVLASSTALYVINSGVMLGLPWWTAVVAPVIVYALVLPLCIPRIRTGGWLIGFFILVVLHVILGLATAWLYAHVTFTSFEEALAPAFVRFPPALVLEMVGSLMMLLPFMTALAPRPAVARIPAETSSPRDASSRRVRDLPATPDRGQQAWARPAKPAEPAPAPVVATIASTIPPPVSVAAPAIEERPETAPEPLTVHAAPLSGTNGTTSEIADDASDMAPDFRQALSELFETPSAAPAGTHVEETLEPMAEPVAEEMTSPPPVVEAAPWTAPEAAPAPPIEVAPVSPAPAESGASGAVVRIPFDRVVGQLPPGAFRVPLVQVGARLREAETLLVAEALILPQLGEGVVQVAWEAVAEQFPAAVFAVAPAEVKERIVNGRLLLPLDEIVKQLRPDVFGASMGRGPVTVPGIESFPAPFKPLGWEEPAPPPAASAAGARTEPVPLSIEVPSEAEVAEDLKWTPLVADAPLEAPADVMKPPPIELPLAGVESPAVSVSEEAGPADGGGPPADVQFDNVRESETMPALAAHPPAVESIPEAVEQERSDDTGAVEPAPAGPAIRIPFARLTAQLPPAAFRVPLPQVGARLREADTLVVAQALILPQLGEGAAHVVWEDVVGQFPADVFAMASADVRDLIQDGCLSLPLDEIVRQLPPDVFGAAMARGPVLVPGIESFPAPFKPLGHEEPVPAVPELPVPEPAVPELVAQPDPVVPAIEVAVADPVPLAPAVEIAVAPPVAVEAAIEVVVPGPAMAPQPVPVAPLYEAQVFERPIPFEPPVPAEPPVHADKHDRAEKIAALMAPLAAALDEVRVGDFTIIGVATAGMAGGAVTAPAGRLGPVIARAATPPIEQVTLRGVGGVLVLTPIGSGWSSGTVLAVGMRSGGALARLEMLASRAATGLALDPPPSPARGAAPFARLDPAETPPALAAAAENLTAFGPLAPQSYRELASSTLVHCLVSPGVSAADLAPFAWELAQVMAQTAPAEALGAFHSAVLRWGSMRVEIRSLPSAAGPPRILVVGGADRGRPGLARLQIERTAARLIEA